jgi:two-component system sensor histidine kinase ArlS
VEWGIFLNTENKSTKTKPNKKSAFFFIKPTRNSKNKHNKSNKQARVNSKFKSEQNDFSSSSQERKNNRSHNTTYSNKGLFKRMSRRVGSSMSLRLSVSYTQMLLDAILSCLLLIIVVYIAYNAIFISVETKNIVVELTQSSKISETIYDLVVQRDLELSIMDESGLIIVNTFSDYNKPRYNIPIWFYKQGNSIYLMIESNLYRSEGNFKLNIFRDITKTLFEMLILFGFTFIVLIIVTLGVFFKGYSLTKKALSPIAEMTKITKGIKAQNLNLRLNVTNTKYELQELVITFNEMMDRIENAYNKQNQFVSDASHELRTPISVIQGYARMLERWGKDDPEVLNESIEAIGNEADNMKELVEKLLFIARNDKDTLILTKDNFSLSEMMDELVRETQMVDGLHEIEHSIEEGIEIFGDRNRIKQAMRILVDNAQKYTEPGKTIEISLKKEDDWAILSVKDSGCGIDSVAINSIFDRFYRADQSRDRNKGGHGLGLSIARIIVLRHGGKINVKSKMGEGSIFSILLSIDQVKN